MKGHKEIKVFLIAKWKKELYYKLKKELWAFTENRIAVRFEYECVTAEGNGIDLMVTRIGNSMKMVL